MTDDPPYRLALEERLGFSQPARGLAKLADLRQRPGG